jgi:hypothetical protein
MTGGSRSPGLPIVTKPIYKHILLRSQRAIPNHPREANGIPVKGMGLLPAEDLRAIFLGARSGLFRIPGFAWRNRRFSLPTAGRGQFQYSSSTRRTLPGRG